MDCTNATSHLSSITMAAQPTITVESVVAKPQNLRTVVKDGYVYVYGQVDGAFLVVRTRVVKVSEAVRERALQAYAVAEQQLLKTKASAQGALVFVDAKMKDGALVLKTQALAARDFSQHKALAGIAALQQAVAKVPVPERLKDGAIFVQTKSYSGVVFVKGGCLRVATKVGDNIVVVKAKAVGSYAGAREELDSILEAASKSVQRRNIQLKDGLAMVQGKVGNLVVRIKSRAVSGQAHVAEALLRCKAAIEELRVTKALRNGATVVSSKVNDVTIYVKDGYLHVMARTGNGVVAVKAKLEETSTATKVKVLEMYVALETTAKSYSDNLVKKALATYDATKLSTLTVAEKAKARADALASKSQAFAAEKPVTASTASGAALGGAGGGLAGLATGAVAGAAAGLPLALFTFGLSVPVGAALGGSAGVAVGATVGSTAGAVGGAAMGYGYEQREQVSAGIDSAKARAAACTDYVKETAISSKDVLAARLRRTSAAGA